MLVLVQEEDVTGRGGNADRHVNPENPRPGPVADDEASCEWSEYRGDRPDAGKIALNFAPLPRRVEIGDDRYRHGLHGAGSDTLNEPKDDHRHHRAGKTGEDRSDEEDDDPHE